jgi:hypothetical protein
VPVFADHCRFIEGYRDERIEEFKEFKEFEGFANVGSRFFAAGITAACAAGAECDAVRIAGPDRHVRRM